MSYLRHFIQQFCQHTFIQVSLSEKDKNKKENPDK